MFFPDYREPAGMAAPAPCAMEVCAGMVAETLGGEAVNTAVRGRKKRRGLFRPGDARATQ